MIYAPETTLRDARALYFSLNGFGDAGGYDERWIKVKVWRVPIWIPNTDGRRKAVRLHDLHHVLTEYNTTWRGEAEISAWEIGSGGLRRYYAGWVLDLMNVAQGLAINPGGVYRGFIRGRHTSNLYALPFTDELLDTRVGDYRSRLALDRPVAEATFRDIAALAFWIAAGVVIYLGVLLLAFSPLLLLAISILRL
jgi:hypothetical protein